ncbi:phage portal protein, SPP1 family [Peptoanaerobacter stomatis]|uniref:Phage portal protein, SPP1 family n=1 Tax=Peptoanaerobacter stomatis TaxID=796937 RepID=J5WDP8_9FIRM|nr:phage portal protein [Peptoanaerobacter stomatis]EJU21177.1 phage portal protein, SPP1 family [Peptoanaerobacter stomatis]
MIYLSEFEVNEINIKKIIEKYSSSELLKLEKLSEYYKNNNEITNRSMKKDAPNNKLASAYAKYVVKMQTGYFIGIPAKHKSSDEEYLSEYTKILDDNFEKSLNYEIAKDMSKFGFGAELIYQNEKSITKIKKISPLELILIASNKIDEFIMCAIRYYRSADIDGNVTEIAEVYDSKYITRFERTKSQASFEQVGQDEHLFDEVPIIIYRNNVEMTSDFENVIELNNAYDTSQSNTANDIDYFNDAYMIVEGASELVEDIDDDTDKVQKTAETLKKNRVMYFPDGGGAKFLVKDINDSATENYKNRLNSDIHKFSLTPDLADEKFAGNLSGIAIKFKTIPLEQSATEKENGFTIGLKKRCELVTNLMNIRLNRNYDYTLITTEFTRNLPQNESEITNTILSLSNVISKRTLLELLPQIEDVDEELKRLGEEQDEYEQRDFEFKENIVTKI